MNNNHGNSGNGFSTGLILGIIIGAAAVFLFGTKRGKRLFKVITEEGLEGISDIGDLIEDMKEENEEIVPETNGNLKSVDHSTSDSEHVAHKSSRRFFKGLRKK